MTSWSENNFADKLEEVQSFSGSAGRETTFSWSVSQEAIFLSVSNSQDQYFFYCQLARKQSFARSASLKSASL
jgi:hypothetical protein